MPRRDKRRARRVSVDKMSTDPKVVERAKERQRRANRQARERAAKAELEGRVSSLSNYVERLQRDIVKLKNTPCENCSLKRNSPLVADTTPFAEPQSVDEASLVSSDDETDETDELESEDGDIESYRDAWNAEELQTKRAEAMRSELMFQKLTALTTRNFDDLAVVMVPEIEKTNEKGQMVEDGVLKPLGWTISATLKLFLALIFLRLYLPYWQITFFFKIPIRQVPKELRRTIAAMERYFAGAPSNMGGIHFPDSDGLAALRVKQAKMQVPDITIDFACDGMHLKVPKPTKTGSMTVEERSVVNNRIKLLHNQKHHCYATNMLAVTDLQGRFVYVDGPHLGSEAEQLKNCGIIDLLRGISACVAADAGLSFNTADNEGTEVAFSSGPGVIRLTKLAVKNIDKLEPELANFFLKIYSSSRLCSRLRIVIENSFAYVRRFACVRDTFRHHYQSWKPLPASGLTQSSIARVCFLLANFLMARSGAMRADDWQPNIDDIQLPYGFPAPARNAKQVENAAARKIYVPKRGKASLAVARATLQKRLDNLKAGERVSAAPAKEKRTKKRKKRKTSVSASSTMSMTSDDNDFADAVSDDDCPDAAIESSNEEEVYVEATGGMLYTKSCVSRATNAESRAARAERRSRK